MTDKLPHNLLALFAPRPALRYLPPSDHAPESRKTRAVGGVAAFMSDLEEYKKVKYEESPESWFERKERIKAEKREAQKLLQDDDHESCKSSKSLVMHRPC